MSVRDLSDKYPEKKELFIEFKTALKQYCIYKEYLLTDELEENEAMA